MAARDFLRARDEARAFLRRGVTHTRGARPESQCWLATQLEGAAARRRDVLVQQAAAWELASAALHHRGEAASRVNAARRFAVEWLRDTPRRFAAKWLRDAAALADFGVSHVVLNGEANVPERRNGALRMCLFARKCCDTCRG